MRQLADDLWLLNGFPPHAINVYLIGDVLIDAATRRAGRRILRQLEGREVNAHALTHAHPDHQGASKEVCEALGIPLWCHTADADAMEQGTIPDTQPDHPINRVIDRFWLGPPHPVARRLEEGDEIAGFTVLHAPGHSAGHVAYWRESDRALILGDVVTNIDTITGIPACTSRARSSRPTRSTTASRRAAWQRSSPSSSASGTASRYATTPSSAGSPTG